MASMNNEPYAVDLPLRVDTRGWLMDTSGALHNKKVAYAYATCCFPGEVKGWHRHARHEDRLFCVEGLARVVAWREESIDSHEWVIGPLAPKLVVVPPGWWHGFTALGAEPCVVVNCPDLPWDPDDEERDDVDAAAFWEWGKE